jgi:hypothetical protein
MQRTRRQRRKYVGRSTEPSAQIAHTVQTTTAHVPGRIVQAAALPARKPPPVCRVVSQVQMPALPRATRTQKERLRAAEEARIGHQLDRLGSAVDDDVYLAREA